MIGTIYNTVTLPDTVVTRNTSEVAQSEAFLGRNPIYTVVFMFG